MNNLRPSFCAFLIQVLLIAGSTSSLSAAEIGHSFCRLVMHEEQAELEDAQLEVGLAQSTLAAHQQIFELIAGLWKADAIDRMSYLEAEHDYAAAKLALDRAGLILDRQQALLEQYRLACDSFAPGKTDGGQAHKIDAVHDRYLRADCNQQQKAIEIARVNLEFNRELLSSVLELRAGQVATRQDVILAKLNVELEEKRLADATIRATACRQRFPINERTATE